MSVEEDSEPLLGLWFEETLAPLDASPTSVNKDTANEATTERNATTIVPDNREPHGVSSKFYLNFINTFERKQSFVKLRLFFSIYL